MWNNLDVNYFLDCEKPENFKSFYSCASLQNTAFNYVVMGIIKSSSSYHFTRLVSELDNLDTVYRKLLMLSNRAKSDCKFGLSVRLFILVCALTCVNIIRLSWN